MKKMIAVDDEYKFNSEGFMIHMKETYSNLTVIKGDRFYIPHGDDGEMHMEIIKFPSDKSSDIYNSKMYKVININRTIKIIYTFKAWNTPGYICNIEFTEIMKPIIFAIRDFTARKGPRLHIPNLPKIEGFDMDTFVSELMDYNIGLDGCKENEIIFLFKPLNPLANVYRIHINIDIHANKEIYKKELLRDKDARLVLRSGYLLYVKMQKLKRNSTFRSLGMDYKLVKIIRERFEENIPAVPLVE